MTDKAVLIGKETALDMQKIVDYFRLHGLLDKPSRSTSELINGPAIYVRNDDATEAPAFACMQVVGTVEVGGQNYLKVDKPADTDGTAGWYVFNGPSAIPAGDFGVAYDGPLCRMLTDGSTVTAGGLWGPVASQWTIAPGGSLFVAAGEDDIAADVMRGFFKGGGGDAILFATRTGGIAARSTTTYPHTFPSATVDLIDPVTGNVYSPNRTETVYNMTNITITHVANRPRQAKKIGTRYFIDVDDC